jgi:hypothetical protein
MANRRSRIRHWIARQLDRLPGQCFADLTMWAQGDLSRTSPWSPISPGCVKDFSRQGACWCGKLRDDTGPGKAVLRSSIRRARRG